MIIECTKKLADAMKMKVKPYDEINSSPFYEGMLTYFILIEEKVLFL